MLGSGGPQQFLQNNHARHDNGDAARIQPYDMATHARIGVVLPGRQWIDAGENRLAQHFAITLLDGLCAALADWREAQMQAMG